MPDIQANLENIKPKLGDARLVAVSKYSEVDDIVKAYDAGQRHFGESRIQDLKEKASDPRLKNSQGIKWHFIGPLQSNKVKKLFEIPNLYYVHSLHSLKVLKLFLSEQQAHKSNICFLLQYNSSHEEEKQGFQSLDELVEAVNLIKSAHQQDIFKGIMTMAVLRTDDWEEGARNCFKECQRIALELAEKEDLEPLELSMGMSRDYEIALEYGANWVRVGSALFK